MKITKKFYGIALAVICGLPALSQVALPLKAQTLYVGNYLSDTIGAYRMDGSTVKAPLITGLDGPEGIAISGNDVFVANYSTGFIGEYTTSGATVNASLITGLRHSSGIAISGNDLFVMNGFAGTVGEYTTSGATVDASLISEVIPPNPTGGGPFGIAISGNDLFVDTIQTGIYGVGEYGLDGSTVNTLLISGLNFGSPDALVGITGIAVSGTNIFVADYNYGTVGEYTTAGGVVNASLITGLVGPLGIAVSGTNLFVACFGTTGDGSGTVGEYTTSGATVNASLISGLDGPYGIVIAPPPPPSFTGISVSGSTLTITGTNGPAGETYTLLASTNLALPYAQWTPVQTNGTFNVNIVNGASPAVYYTLEVP